MTSPERSSRERRSDSRVPTSLRAVTVRGEQEHQVELGNLSVGGAFVRVRTVEELPPVGSALRMKLRLPVGYWLCGTVVVRWIETESRARGYGVEFDLLGEYDKLFLKTHLDAIIATGEPLAADLTLKFRVDRDERAVVIWINGHLTEGESEELAQEIARQRGRWGAERPCLYLNAGRFAASSRLALDHLIAGLRSFADLPNLVGVLVESSSVARAQMRRVVRDAGLGEALVCYTSEEDASLAWGALYEEQASRRRLKL